MIYQVLDERGEAMDARLEIDRNEFVFYSRGGKRGDPGARNLDYGAALRLLLHRIANSDTNVEAVWIDSDEVLHLPRDDRRIFDGATSEPDQQFSAISKSMQSYGRPADAAYGGSRVKKIRIRLNFAESTADLVRMLRLTEATTEPRLRERLPSTLFDAITAEHVWEAVQLLEAGEEHPFGPSRDFELISADGARLPPKAVFGVAARLALGRTIGPQHFTGGIAGRCHRTLALAGFEIVPIGEPSPSAVMPMAAEDREWSEGQPKLVTHLKRERAPGLARAKKRAFIRVHGRLHCERCGLDPVEVFGVEVGEACIEVHHDRTEISRMGDGERTTLADLKCLCANCHRVVHAEIRRALAGVADSNRKLPPKALAKERIARENSAIV